MRKIKMDKYDVAVALTGLSLLLYVLYVFVHMVMQAMATTVESQIWWNFFYTDVMMLVPFVALFTMACFITMDTDGTSAGYPVVYFVVSSGYLLFCETYADTRMLAPFSTLMDALSLEYSTALMIALLAGAVAICLAAFDRSRALRLYGMAGFVCSVYSVACEIIRGAIIDDMNMTGIGLLAINTLFFYSTYHVSTLPELRSDEDEEEDEDDDGEDYEGELAARTEIGRSVLRFYLGEQYKRLLVYAVNNEAHSVLRAADLLRAVAEGRFVDGEGLTCSCERLREAYSVIFDFAVSVNALHGDYISENFIDHLSSMLGEEDKSVFIHYAVMNACIFYDEWDADWHNGARAYKERFFTDGEDEQN